MAEQLLHEQVGYIIRRKADGWVMPDAAMTRGFTSLELSPPGECRPRILNTLSGAKNALRWWCEGAFRKVLHRDWETNIVDDEDLEADPRPERKAEDMEIIPVVLTIRREGFSVHSIPSKV